MKIYVAGEGRHEVGKWEESEERWSISDRGNGVLYELFSKSGRRGDVIAGTNWKNVRKYRAGDHATPEQRTLKGLAVDARRRGAELVLWARDSDHKPVREKELVAMQNELRATCAGTMTICGGVAEPAIEAWIITLAKKHANPDSLTTAKAETLANQHGFASGDKMIAVIEQNDLDASLSPSLQNWLKQLELIPADG